MVTNVLKISEAASLAMHTAAMLAVDPTQMLSAGHVASVLQVSPTHLAKVLQRLAHVGIVRSVRGPKGGFILQKDPRLVSLLEVYEAIEGPLRPTNCLLGKKVCSHGHCILGNLVKSVDEQVKQYLAGTKIAELAAVYGGKK